MSDSDTPPEFGNGEAWKGGTEYEPEETPVARAFREAVDRFSAGMLAMRREIKGIVSAIAGIVRLGEAENSLMAVTGHDEKRIRPIVRRCVEVAERHPIPADELLQAITWRVGLHADTTLEEAADQVLFDWEDR